MKMCEAGDSCAQLWKACAQIYELQSLLAATRFGHGRCKEHKRNCMLSSLNGIIETCIAVGNGDMETVFVLVVCWLCL